MLFPPPGAPSIRIVLGLGHNKEGRSKPSNEIWFVSTISDDNGDDGGGGGGCVNILIKKLVQSNAFFVTKNSFNLRVQFLEVWLRDIDVYRSLR